ncbi:VOC family protein [Spirillospora sp. CA-253888]
MPSITGWSHLTLTVRDLDVSVRWYCDLFGLTEFAKVVNDGWTEVICVYPEGLMILGFTQHDDAGGARYDHRNPGLDHLAFGVADRAELERWRERFAELGVVHSPIAETPWGPVLSFRDPDDVQLELFVTEYTG